MKKTLRTLAVVLALSLLAAVLPVGITVAKAEDLPSYDNYDALDKSDPAGMIDFNGKTVTWGSHTWYLDEYTLFLDYRLESAQIKNNPYAFNNVTDAFNAVKNGAADKPMTLLIAPGVYWVTEFYDETDPAAFISGTEGHPLTGHTFDHADYLWFYGLNSNKDNVVIASNRGWRLGSNFGSDGNYTMIGFPSDAVGLRSSNITFGNYCNVDLDFPLKDPLETTIKVDAQSYTDIAQAQLFSGGSNAICENTGFVSRSNLRPLTGFYKDCRFAGSDLSGADSLFVGCYFELHSSNVSGGRYFNCDIEICPSGSDLSLTGDGGIYRFCPQDDTDANNMSLVDVRFIYGDEMKARSITAEIFWDKPDAQPQARRNYQHNVKLDGDDYVVQNASYAGDTVVIQDTSDLLNAFRIENGSNVYYNIANIVGAGAKLGDFSYYYEQAIRTYAAANNMPEEDYFSIPYSASLSLSASAIRSGASTATAAFSASHNDSDLLGDWTVTTMYPEDAAYVHITDNGNGTATIAGTNNTRSAVDVVIVARNSLGVEAASILTVEPPYVNAPIKIRLTFDDNEMIGSTGSQPAAEDAIEVTTYDYTQYVPEVSGGNWRYDVNKVLVLKDEAGNYFFFGRALGQTVIEYTVNGVTTNIPVKVVDEKSTGATGLTQYVVSTVTDPLNIRQGAGMGTAVVGRFAIGTVISGRAVNSSWAEVYNDDGSVRGYCSLKYLLEVSAR